MSPQLSPSPEPSTQNPRQRTPRTPLAAQVLAVLVIALAAAPYWLSFAVGLGALIYVLVSGPIPVPHWTAVAFLVWCAVTVTWSELPGQSLKSLLMLAVFTVALWGLVGHLSPTAVHSALSGAMKVMVTVTVLLFLVVPSVGREVAGDHVGALRGNFPTRNAAAFVLGIALLLFLFQAVGPMVRPAAGSAAWCVVTLAALVATESSTGLTVALLGCATLLFALRMHRWRSWARRSVAFLLVAGTVVAVVASLRNITLLSGLLGRDTTLTGRTDIWRAAGPFLDERPWWGYGWGGLWSEYSTVTRVMWADARFIYPNAHNAYIDAILQVGIVGLVLLVLIVVAILWAAGQRVLSHRGDPWATWPLAVVVLLLVHSISESSMVSYNGFGLLVIALALLHSVGTLRPPVAGEHPTTAAPPQ